MYILYTLTDYCDVIDGVGALTVSMTMLGLGTIANTLYPRRCLCPSASHSPAIGSSVKNSISTIVNTVELAQLQ